MPRADSASPHPAARSARQDAGSKLPWNHITDQIGMFAYSGMTGCTPPRDRAKPLVPATSLAPLLALVAI